MQVNPPLYGDFGRLIRKSNTFFYQLILIVSSVIYHFDVMYALDIFLEKKKNKI